ncbi:MAG: enoyl-CoA hydratase/isomerase family protein [Methylibium sp.]|uniref:enoyl-CoA hydratase/isomerase family protein n=1 Tax=Methylibium sp. TaxID=2067992 RepID=UPI0017E7DF4A|nr:enoyl-CoA hydratase-related protein [Methylibium sp.]MBA3596372.1 enoyl-CoA hydratase/isomerase family protein [Methylibium sp.]
MSGSIRFERDAGDARIGRIVIAHPVKLGAISVAMWRSLRDIAASLDAMVPTLHSVIVCGEGGNFAAGADIAEFPDFRFDPDTLRDYHEGVIAPALHALRATDVPLIAQIEGACVGGGLEIAACCDLRIGQPDARLGAPVATLGFPMAPDELAAVLAAFGRAGAAELLLEAGLLDAASALQRRLLHRVADDAASEAWATAQRIARNPASVARANKRTLRQLLAGGPTEPERAAHFGYAASVTHREGVAAFLEHRAPDFHDDQR